MIKKLLQMNPFVKIAIIFILFATSIFLFPILEPAGYFAFFAALFVAFEGFEYFIVEKYKYTLIWKILIALALAFAVSLSGFFNSEDLTTIRPVGSKIFMNLLTMALVPLVFSSILTGVTSLGDIKKLNRIGAKTLAYYITTTGIAISIGLSVANILQPGSEISDEVRIQFENSTKASAESMVTKAETRKQTAFETLQGIVPRNIVNTVSGPKPEMLGLIFFAIMCGLALLQMNSKAAAPVIHFFEGITEMTIKLVIMAMRLAPYGVFAIIASTIAATQSLDLILALVPFSLCVLIGLALHAFGTNAFSLFFLSKRPVISSFVKMREVALMAFSTSSSGGTMPFTLQTTQNDLKVKKHVASFVIPLGATVNMDGTALFQGVSAIFLANIYGIELNFAAQLTVVGMAVMASIGTAAVPGVGIVILTMILVSVGIPPEGILFILPVNNILDMCRTSVNVMGDMTCAIYIDKTEEGSANS